MFQNNNAQLQQNNGQQMQNNGQQQYQQNNGNQFQGQQQQMSAPQGVGMFLDPNAKAMTGGGFPESGKWFFRVDGGENAPELTVKPNGDQTLKIRWVGYGCAMDGHSFTMRLNLVNQQYPKNQQISQNQFKAIMDNNPNMPQGLNPSMPESWMNATMLFTVENAAQNEINPDTGLPYREIKIKRSDAAHGFLAVGANGQVSFPVTGRENEPAPVKQEQQQMPMNNGGMMNNQMQQQPMNNGMQQQMQQQPMNNMQQQPQNNMQQMNQQQNNFMGGNNNGGFVNQQQQPQQQQQMQNNGQQMQQQEQQQMQQQQQQQQPQNNFVNNGGTPNFGGNPGFVNNGQ